MTLYYCVYCSSVALASPDFHASLPPPPHTHPDEDDEITVGGGDGAMMKMCRARSSLTACVTLSALCVCVVRGGGGGGGGVLVLTGILGVFRCAIWEMDVFGANVLQSIREACWHAYCHGSCARAGRSEQREASSDCVVPNMDPNWDRLHEFVIIIEYIQYFVMNGCLRVRAALTYISVYVE